MKIPVFVSVGSKLSSDQEEIYQYFLRQMNDFYDLDPRTVGRTEAAMRTPLTEVTVLAKHCAGALILGFEEYQISDATKNLGGKERKSITNEKWSTPWNQIEAGICRALRLPLMIFGEGVNGGIFDVGSSDIFIQTIPRIEDFENSKPQINKTLASWRGEVEMQFYSGERR